MYEKIDVSTLLVQITDRCNLNCKHCFLSGGKPGEMPVDSLEKIIKEAVRFGIKEIVLTGGEPFVHAEINKVINLLYRYPQINFGFVTNGTVLDEDMVKKIEQRESVYIQISFDGSRKEIYEQIRGIGIFEKFWNGLELVAASRVKDKRTRTAVSAINYQDVGNICKIAYDKKMDSSFLSTVKMGNASIKWEELELNHIQKMKVNNVIQNFNRQYGTKFGLLVPPSVCCFSVDMERKSFNINTKGDVYTCDFLSDFPLGNILQEDFEMILRGESLRRLYDMGRERCRKMEMGVCRQCEVKSECYFGCPALAMNAGNIYGCDMYYHYRRLFYGCMAANLI